MYVCMCMYVYLYVCVCVCMYVCIFVCKRFVTAVVVISVDVKGKGHPITCHDGPEG